MEGACVQDCIWRMQAEGSDCYSLYTTLRGHFSSTVSGSGLPSAEKALGNWSESGSKPRMRCGGPEVHKCHKRYLDPDEPGEGESHCRPQLPHVWLGRTQGLPGCPAKEDKRWTQAMARWILTLWEKNKSTPPEDGLALEEWPRKALCPGDKPQLDKAFATWLNFDVISALSNWVDSNVQKSLPA